MSKSAPASIAAAGVTAIQGVPGSSLDVGRRVALLEKSPLGSDLSLAARRDIVLAASCRQVAAGVTLFSEAEPALLFYIVAEGQVRLSQLSPDGHQVIIHHSRAGDAIGVIVVLSGIPYPVTAVTLEPSLLLAWDKPTITALMHRHAQLTINSLGIVSRRFAEMQARFRELATERVERRIARTLLRLVNVAGKQVPNGILIDMTLSRQDLAEMTGTTLFSVSRILSEWERRGWVESGRERVTLCHPHEIVIIAEELPEPHRK